MAARFKKHFTTSSLTNNTAYRVRVRAVNAAGYGAWARGSGTPSAPPPPPPASLTLAVSSARLAGGGDAVTLTATLHAPAPAGGTRVTLAASGESTATVTDDYALSAATIAIAAGATTGSVMLTAAADAVEDPGEAIVLVATSVNPVLTSDTLALVIAHAPGAPAGLRLSPGDRSLAVSWSEPASDGDAAITGYDVQHRASGASGWEAVARSGTMTFQTLGGLAGGTGYTVRVRAENAVGAGPWAQATAHTPGVSPLFGAVRGWLARSGQAVSGQVLGAVEGRLVGPRTPGARATLAGRALPDRLSAWAAAGYGAGEVVVQPGGRAATKADLTMTMGAAGVRGELARPPADGNGFSLAAKADTRFARTSSGEGRDAGGGRMAAADADTWLARAGFEGARRFAMGDSDAGATLTPSFELGARLDGGDAAVAGGTGPFRIRVTSAMLAEAWRAES